MDRTKKNANIAEVIPHAQITNISDEQPKPYTPKPHQGNPYGWTPAWIPVEESLPEETGNYLVSTDDGNVRIANYVHGEEGGWVKGSNWGELTAWMPLPKPHKVKMNIDAAMKLLEQKKDAMDPEIREALAIALGSMEDSKRLKKFLEWYGMQDSWPAEDVEDEIARVLAKR